MNILLMWGLTKLQEDWQMNTLTNSFEKCKLSVLDPVTESEMDKEIKQLNENKSSGRDDVAPKAVKKIGEYIVKPLAHIMCLNLPIVTGIIPETYNITIVTSVYKGNDKEKLSNYRPISVLPCFSKTLEKMTYKRVNDFLDEHKQ